MRCLLALLFVAISLSPARLGPSAHADETGSVTGRVTFSGNPPRQRMVLVNKEPEVCGHGSREFRWVDVGDEKALRDVVVFLDRDAREGEWKHPEEGYVLTQEGCRFDPYILLFSKDRHARLTIVNSDPTLHNVRMTQILGRVKPTLLNLSQPQGRPPKTKPLRLKPGSLTVEVKCDVHEFMQGWIFAADNPHCVQVEKDGTFVLEGLEPGDHTIGAWHPYLGIHRGEVTVNKDGETSLNFTFSMQDLEKP